MSRTFFFRVLIISILLVALMGSMAQAIAPTAAFSCSPTSGLSPLTVTYTSSAGVASTALAYGGASLTAGALYPLEILTGASESINFHFSATGGSYRLIVREM